MDAQSPLCRELHAAFAWWRDAGIDCDFADAPTDWLRATVPPDEPQVEFPAHGPAKLQSAPTSSTPASIDTASLPRDLSGFVDWWLCTPQLDSGNTNFRIAPRGPGRADLMVVVPEPEREDRDILLSGPQGSLLANMLRAMGCDTSRVYFASVLPRHLPGADWQTLATGNIGPVLRHHIALVSPKRLIAFGGNILPLFGNDLPQGAAVLRQINLEGQSIPMLATRSLPALIDRPRWKGDVWKAWLGWTGPADRETTGTQG